MNSETAVAVPGSAPLAADIERVLIGGDLKALTVEQRIAYHDRVCASLGLNPLTRPFEYVTFQGKTILYARRDCADQLRKIHGISITIAGREMLPGDIYMVTARATDAKGRHDEAVGALCIKGKVGEELANALMKTETKAKRRVTLSICGLGMHDETEVDDPTPRVDVATVAQDTTAETVAFWVQQFDALDVTLPDAVARYQALAASVEKEPRPIAKHADIIAAYQRMVARGKEHKAKAASGPQAAAQSEPVPEPRGEAEDGEFSDVGEADPVEQIVRTFTARIPTLKNVFEGNAWAKKHRAEIDALPANDSEAVWAAHAARMVVLQKMAPAPKGAA